MSALFGTVRLLLLVSLVSGRLAEGVIMRLVLATCMVASEEVLDASLMLPMTSKCADAFKSPVQSVEPYSFRFISFR